METVVQKVLEKMGKVRKLELASLTLLFTTILTLCGKVRSRPVYLGGLAPHLKTTHSLGSEEILQFYQLRFQIEFIFRDAKQFIGLSER